jgi:hypothetical protein
MIKKNQNGRVATKAQRFCISLDGANPLRPWVDSTYLGVAGASIEI